MAVTTLHADCADCQAAAQGAEHRDPATGQLVIDHQATWTR